MVKSPEETNIPLGRILERSQPETVQARNCEQQFHFKRQSANKLLSFLLRLGMGLIINPGHFIQVKMGVTLGGGDTAVSQKLLDTP